MIVMMKKRDFFNRWGKKLCALFLSAEMALSSVSGMVLNVYAAANVAEFQFEHVTGTRDRTATIVAGASLPIRGRIPANFSIRDPFFNISRGNDNATTKKFFRVDSVSSQLWTLGVDITAGDKTYHALDPSEQDFPYNTEAQYSLNGVLVSTVAEQGKVDLKATDSKDSDKVYGVGQVDIRAENPLGITEAGGFKFNLQFEVSAIQDDAGKITGYDVTNGGWNLIDNDNYLKDSSGWFAAQYPTSTGQESTFNSTQSGTNLGITISSGIQGNNRPPAANFTITGLNQFLQQCINAKLRELNLKKPDEITGKYDYNDEDFTFTIYVNFATQFEVPTGNPMILTVYRPVQALEQIVQTLQVSPDTAADELNQKLIDNLANGDSLIDQDVGISQKFTVKKNITRFNSRNFNIQWSWVPKGDINYRKEHSNVVEFQSGNNTVLVKPAKESVEGYLVARIFYTPQIDIREKQTDADPFKPVGGTDGAVVEKDENHTAPLTIEDLKLGDSVDNENGQTAFEIYRKTAVIPITVLGTGDPPEVKFEKQVIGGFEESERKQEDKIIEDVKFPLHMGTYDGGSDPKYFSQPTVPYKYTGSIRFGTLGGKADRLVITQTQVGGGEVELYTEQDTQYTFGTDIPNEETGTGQFIVPFTIRAIKPGTVRLNFNFYNRAGNLVPGGRGVYEFEITIDDNSPNPDPTLKQLQMVGHLIDNPTEMIKKSFYDNFPNGIMDFGFDPQTWEYGSITDPITLPASVKYLTFNTAYNVERNKYPITISWVRDISTDSGIHEITKLPGPTGPIPVNSAGNAVELVQDSVYTIRFTCTAETGDTAIYTLYVKREQESNDAFLKSLSVYPDRESDVPYTMEPEFNSEFYAYHEEPDKSNIAEEPDKKIITENPENVYVVHVPYRQREEGVDIRAIANNAWASSIDIKKEENLKKRATVSFISRIAATINPEKKEIIKDLNYDPANPSDPTYNLTVVNVTVWAENGEVETIYKLHIYVDDPSKNSYIQEPKVSYWLKGIQPRPKEEQPVKIDEFDPIYEQIFTEMIPYSAETLKVVITPEDYLATGVTIWPENFEQQAKQYLPHLDKNGEPQPVEFMIENVGQYFNARNRMILNVRVDPEDPELAGKGFPYQIIIDREEPNRDKTANITLTNMLTSALVTPDEGFDYSEIVDDYDVEIDYTPGDMQLLVKVEPNAPTTTVTVNGEIPRADGTLVKLDVGKNPPIVIVLTAEDGSSRTVTINVTYKAPSKNCYLQDLKAGTLLFRPIPTPFDKKKLNYKIEIPKGMTTIPITAWLLKDGSKDDSSNATITINDKKVGDGEAYNFMPTEKTGKIKVVVTAQDGKTKRTYTISYKNWNLLKPSDEDMLKDLWVDYADMQPKFDSSITEYEVYLKPEAMDIKVYPKLRDSSCKIEVTAESKVLTEFEDYYSTSLMDDEMDIHVYVWSEQAIVNNMSSNTTGGGAAGGGGSATVLPDKEENPPRTTAREYVLHLYRNDEEKIGNFKPLPAEDVDFVSSDPIVIDITQYPIISADVFKTLKEDYPDKSIIFKGNDYTLQIFGADIDGVIPNVESFDLRFSFRTPDEKKIRDAMDAAGNNSHIEPVYYYFNQHGALPAEMLLTVDLGRHYSNETLFWNYYNQERDRIDYYGYVHTNAKGTFSVPISHFSTYLSTSEKIRGAENKSDEYGNPIPFTEETENLNSANSANKDIPNTAAPISFTVPSLNQTSAAQQPVPYTSSSAGSVAARTTAPAIDMALPERKKLSPVRKKSTDMPTGILK